ncbi:MAG: SixA phosphatase family protein [Actinomycetota bacterium]
MRRLLLLRHAKSSWSDATARDHDRPLNARGRRAAPLVGDYLRREDLVPDRVLCSSARRTCETLALLDLPDTTDGVIEHDLYLAHPETVLEAVRGTVASVTSLMVIGHNPTMHELALDLAHGGDVAARAALGRGYPTAALAALGVTGDWAGLESAAAVLDRFVTPRDLE